MTYQDDIKIIPFASSKQEILRLLDTHLADLYQQRPSSVHHVLNESTRHYSRIVRSNDCIISSHHQGDDYEHIVAGPVSAILHYTDTTSNEREHAVGVARQHAVDHEVIAIGRSSARTTYKETDDIRTLRPIELLGIIVK